MELDLGVVVNPIPHPDLVLIPLCEDEVALWHSPDVSPHADPVICDPDLVQSQTLLKRLRRARGSAPRLLTTSSLEVATTLAAEGIGPAILPTRVVNASLHRGKLRRARSIAGYSDQIALIYRVENRKVRAITELVSAIARRL
jgi:DNA-binding transcriptional LysR family regulator